MFLRFLPIRQRVRYNCKKRFTACANQELIQENVKLKDSCQGKRCFILGNGPSIKKEDLNLLADEIVFTVNDMYLYEQFNRLNTNYHLLFDPAYFADISKIIKKVNEAGGNTPTIITSLAGKQQMADNFLPNQFIYLESGFDIAYIDAIGLNIDYLLPYYCTVIQYALSLAIEMGFTQIYLLGCDCTGIQNFLERKQGELPTAYCFEMNEEDEKRIKNTTVMSCEHAFYEWHHIFKSYRLLKQIADKRGIGIVDLTEGGVLDVFPKERLANICRSVNDNEK